MGKKTLAISVKENEYLNVHSELDSYNGNKNIEEKITCSKFLFKLLTLGFKAYKMSENDFGKAHELLDESNESDHFLDFESENKKQENLKSFVRAKFKI